ncbi:MAG: SDR family oxidoreductase [Armatimonadetes bacterium]|nr:SDR family oxidoreductase [Armatimonadota bacterium]NCP28837.1 SDR family oxidoreductase [Armatimonadota bacterium]NCQ28377.1 SDR family oxidoreductase [Armatimonadota bacterium]
MPDSSPVCHKRQRAAASLSSAKVGSGNGGYAAARRAGDTSRVWQSFQKGRCAIGRKTFDLKSQCESIPARYPELKGQVALVTGSTKHIGKGIAARLAREGMKVVITSRTAEAVDETVAELIAVGAEAVGVPADIGCMEDIERLFGETLSAFGTVHLLVNNAADLRRDHMFKVPETLVDSQLASNIKGPYMCSLRAAQLMRDHGHGGNLVNISTVGALRAHWPGLPYDMTKGALDVMTKCMALDLADFGIRVNCLGPGPIHRGRTSDHPHAQPLLERVPLRTFGTPLDIAAAVAFLASPDAEFITGQILYVDGGLTVQLTPRGQPI